MEHLSHAERKTLEALNAAGTRWHSVYVLTHETKLDRRSLIAALKNLHRRDLVTPRNPRRDLYRSQSSWSITTMGAQALDGHEQLSLVGPTS